MIPRIKNIEVFTLIYFIILAILFILPGEPISMTLLLYSVGVVGGFFVYDTVALISNNYLIQSKADHLIEELKRQGVMPEHMTKDDCEFYEEDGQVKFKFKTTTDELKAGIEKAQSDVEPCDEQIFEIKGFRNRIGRFNGLGLYDEILIDENELYMYEGHCDPKNGAPVLEEDEIMLSNGLIYKFSKVLTDDDERDNFITNPEKME